ncbi:hypothetical protein ABIE85_001466 [Bradyrhizobium diazoefficiens]|uniref:hypothetical protein n=1 Tax=Bradyrhizobium diazoefficiens TaxID=1355477 RepID=UPI00272AF251|nr:hypothetical protein [Bradyrhizobium diazoefficiens]WLA60279.1 hypothetical protein QIH81_16920 [Bradyrhizobium diazoefficiens]
MATKDESPQTPREVMDKIYAMTPSEFSQFMAGHFQRMCSKPLPSEDDLPCEGMNK